MTTEKWLLKLGFDEENTIDGTWYYREPKINVSFGLIRIIGDGWELYTGSKKINYVQEVMNLFFSLTGEELKLREDE